MKVKFLKSGVKPEEYPFPYQPEVAVVGRSNAGKSSFINALVKQKIAKVSQTPGKTRLLNFFDLDDKLYMVDMPGYGFATGNRREVEFWRTMIETYLKERKTLKGVLLIMDIRRDWDEEEEMLAEWFAHNDIKWALILNKTDKLSRSQMLNKKNAIQKKLGVPVYALSSAKKTGFDEVKTLLFKEWIK
ncbi:MAG: ribosome biogenesis GTP-binding protein YihA/YsxC [Bdellovibrionales bacterium]|nr:ribosome biogenesis GTP-binding protein YihA/YsxC [Bdellovibrionales bacterium]